MPDATPAVEQQDQANSARAAQSKHRPVEQLHTLSPQVLEPALHHAPPRMPHFFPLAVYPAGSGKALPIAWRGGGPLGHEHPLSLEVWHLTLRFALPGVGLATLSILSDM